MSRKTRLDEKRRSPLGSDALRVEWLMGEDDRFATRFAREELAERRGRKRPKWRERVRDRGDTRRFEE